VTLRARWVTLRARWVTLRARWVALRARWVALRARWVSLRARWVALRARWVAFTGAGGARGEVAAGQRGARAAKSVAAVVRAASRANSPPPPLRPVSRRADAGYPRPPRSLARRLEAGRMRHAEAARRGHLRRRCAQALGAWAGRARSGKGRAAVGALVAAARDRSITRAALRVWAAAAAEQGAARGRLRTAVGHCCGVRPNAPGLLGWLFPGAGGCHIAHTHHAASLTLIVTLIVTP
jgi:hypothetical protein